MHRLVIALVTLIGLTGIASISNIASGVYRPFTSTMLSAGYGGRKNFRLRSTTSLK